MLAGEPSVLAIVEGASQASEHHRRAADPFPDLRRVPFLQVAPLPASSLCAGFSPVHSQVETSSQLSFVETPAFLTLPPFLNRSPRSQV
jgi:hypothetical protein